MPEFVDTDPTKPPQISEGYASYVRETATKIEREHPNDPIWQEHAAKLRRDLDGLAPPIPTDSRTPQQIAHDRRFGVSYAPDGKPSLPSVLASVIQRDAAGSAPNPTNVAEQLKAAGRDADKGIGEAQT